MAQEVFVKRSDPVYMAHAYLTKVPLAAIEPFIEAFTRPGDIVVDPFAGSGMTGVAAAGLGRRSRLFDISVLGRHIGSNYVNLVDPMEFRAETKAVVGAVRDRLGAIYSVRCDACQGVAELAKTVWSFVMECPGCGSPVNFYRALEAAGWHKSRMACPECAVAVDSKARRIGEEPVLDYVVCPCSPTQREQTPSSSLAVLAVEGLDWPHVEIGADRQMYQAQSLGKHGMTNIEAFYSLRNIATLAALREAISQVENVALREKLLFAFTAILTRASKRYQWSKKRPLNAANANYYVAPVFYEWNVFDLFERKVEAAIRSDDYVRSRRGDDTLFASAVDSEYQLASADAIPLPDHSVDYVFTDPPFGSNLFYADMAIFQEAWLGSFTDHGKEAVIDRGSRKKRDGDRYETLLSGALSECRRILKPDGWVTMVFGNSTGAVWALVQRAVRSAGLVIVPETISILNKGQRSVKGLASGFEHVATMDLILSMRAADESDLPALVVPTASEIQVETTRLLGDARADSASHLYLELLRSGIAQGWNLAGIDLRLVTDTVRANGWDVDRASGRLVRAAA